MPAPCALGSACIIGDTIWFAGGLNSQDNEKDSAMRIGAIDPDEPTRIAWLTGPRLPCPGRVQGPTVAMGGKVYLIAGAMGPDSVQYATPEVWVFDPMTRAFDTLPRLPETCCACAGVGRESAGEIYKLAGIPWGDPLNYYCKLRVGPSQAVTERAPLHGDGVASITTVVRGTLRLPAASSLPDGARASKPQASSYLLDVSGRAVQKLHPGGNDVNRVAPGVYFLRSAECGQRPAVGVRKVVLTR
jgi:hypothetical protein